MISKVKLSQFLTVFISKKNSGSEILRPLKDINHGRIWQIFLLNGLFCEKVPARIKIFRSEKIIFFDFFFLKVDEEIFSLKTFWWFFVKKLLEFFLLLKKPFNSSFPSDSLIIKLFLRQSNITKKIWSKTSFFFGTPNRTKRRLV